MTDHRKALLTFRELRTVLVKEGRWPASLDYVSRDWIAGDLLCVLDDHGLLVRDIRVLPTQGEADR